MEKELFFIIMAKYMRGNLKIMKSKDMVQKLILMDLYIVDSLRMEKEMVRVGFNGPMDKFMMANGLIMLNMAVVYGRAKIPLPLISGNGVMELFLGLEC